MLFAFDTSSLSVALGSDDVLWMALGALPHGCRAMLPWDVLEELLADSKQSRLIPAARRLGRCLAMHPDRLLVCDPGYHTVRETEWRVKFNVGGFRPLPIKSWIVAEAARYLLQPDLAEVNQSLRTEIIADQKKEFSLNHDKGVRELVPSQMPASISTSEKSKILATFAQRILSTETHWLSLVSRSSKHLRRIRREPHRYKSAVMLASYSYLIALGAALGDLGYPENPDILRAPRAGDWVDAAIAAGCAWSGYLISDDAGQRAKVNFISQQFGWKLRAVPLSEVNWLKLGEQTQA